MLNNCNVCGLREICKEDKQVNCENFEVNLKHEIKINSDNEKNS